MPRVVRVSQSSQPRTLPIGRKADIQSRVKEVRRIESNGQAVTPDGRYLVVRGRLWRRADPSLTEPDRQAAVNDMMQAGRDVGSALRDDNRGMLRRAREQVDAAKRRLGERGPVWWTDGAPDYGRHLVKNTPYAEWWRTLGLK